VFRLDQLLNADRPQQQLPMIDHVQSRQGIGSEVVMSNHIPKQTCLCKQVRLSHTFPPPASPTEGHSGGEEDV
jgi:hypothetical protein